MSDKLIRIGQKQLVLSVGSELDDYLDGLPLKRWMQKEGIQRQIYFLEFLRAEECEAFVARSDYTKHTSFGGFLEDDEQSAASFLKVLFDQIVPMFGLSADKILDQLYRDYVPAIPRVRKPISISFISSNSIAIVEVTASVGANRSFQLLSTEDHRQALQCIHVAPRLMGSQNGTMIAALEGEVSDALAECVFLGSNAAFRLDVAVSKYRDLEGYLDYVAKADPEMLGFVSTLNPVANNAVKSWSERQKYQHSLQDLIEDVRFSIDTFVSTRNGVFLNAFVSDQDENLESAFVLDHSLVIKEIVSKSVKQQKVVVEDGEHKTIQNLTLFIPRTKESDVWSANPLLAIKLKTGQTHLIRAKNPITNQRKARSAIMKTISSWMLDQGPLFSVYEEAITPIQDSVVSRGKIATIRRLGRASARTVSFVIPIYREISFIRSQLIAFCSDSYLSENAEFIFVNDDPADEKRVMNYLLSLSDVYPLDICFVSLSENMGYAGANNFGAQVAISSKLVLLNSDVIPTRPFWLKEMLDRLDQLPPHSVIGPKLIYANGSLQHAGMYFERIEGDQWQNLHYWKGYGRNFSKACVAGGVPAVTGACMVLDKETFASVGGFSTDYVIGDYEDSDLCLKLRANGGAAYYMPSVELFHFERQSIVANKQYSDNGSTAYNRAKHTIRWNAEITKLMEDFKEK